MQILASCCLALKYDEIYFKTSEYFAAQTSFKLESFIICVVYYGYVFLISLFTLAAMSGDPPKGNYVSILKNHNIFISNT